MPKKTPNKFILNKDSLQEWLDDAVFQGVVKIDGKVSLVFNANNGDGGWFDHLTDEDRKLLIEALSNPDKLDSV